MKWIVILNFLVKVVRFIDAVTFLENVWLLPYLGMNKFTCNVS